MTEETKDLLTDWRAVWGELFPYRDPEAMPVDDATLAMGVLLRREMRGLFAKQIPSANAHGLDPQRSVRSKKRGSSHDD